MPTLEGRIRSLISKQAITRIDFRVTARKVIAEAIPSGFHPIVEERRNKHFQDRAGKSLTIDDMNDYTTGCLKPIARVEAESFDGAIDMIKHELTKGSND